MKRVKSACILQTLVFSQKPELELPVEQSQKLNAKDYDNYIASLNRANTRFQIIDEAYTDDGSIMIHIRKQYNDKTDVSDYFM